MRPLVVLPTYNEIANVVPMLEALREYQGLDVVVVDDASPDGTGELAQTYAQSVKGVTVLHRSGKTGLGSAYRAGFAWALERNYSHVVEIDCDFSHDPRSLGSLLTFALTHDVVVGSRYVPGGATSGWSLSRQFLSRAGGLYASTLLGLHIKDPTSGFRVYSARGLERLDYASVSSDGYGFQIEMTYRARLAELSITEVPITFCERAAGSSKMSPSIVIEALSWVTRTALTRT